MTTAVLLGWACEATESRLGNDDEVEIASLPIWHGDITLTIGGAPGPEDDFIRPVPLGADQAGSVYVIDPRALEVRRFDTTGTFSDLFVRPGQGPGEMRSPAQSYGLTRRAVWYSDGITGRLHFVNLDGTGSTVVDSGWPVTRVGGLGSIGITKIYPTEGGEYWLEGEFIDQAAELMRPPFTFLYLRANRDTAHVVHRYDAPGRSVVFDGGGTSMRYPGPPDDPIVFRAGVDRIIRIDRPYPEEGSVATAMIQLFDGSGEVARSREIHVPAARLSPEKRDSIEDALVFAATWEGDRPLDGSTRRQIREFLAAIPERLPAFDEAAQGPDGSIWLRLGAEGIEVRQRWLVLDSLFTPIAQALVPHNVATMAFRRDESWWATINAPDGEPRVARLRFDNAAAGN